MRRARFLPVGLVALIAAALIAVLLNLRLGGYGSASGLDLWGRTLLANAGLLSLNDIVTAYPPLPYIGTIGLSAAIPTLGDMTPLVLASLLAAILSGAWFVNMRAFGYGLTSSLISILVMTLNPLFLRAVAEGPDFILLHWGVWLLALGIFNLRRGYRVNDIILVSFSLILISLSHPFGLMLAFASIPFIALVVPPELLRTSPREVFLVLLFPLLFTIFGFIYLNWIFAGDPLHFATTLNSETTSISSDESPLLTGILSGLAVIAACPLGIALLIKTRRLPPLSFAAMGMLGTLVAASFMAALIGRLPPLMLVGSLGLTFGAACAVRWPRNPARQGSIATLLLGGFMGSVVLTFADPSTETARWRSAMVGAPVMAPDVELADLGRALVDQKAILFDAEAAPSVLAARGYAKGIWTADTAQFQLAGLHAAPDANIIVVRSQNSDRGVDGIGRMFPELFERGAPDYELFFNGEQWRAYARRSEVPE